MKEIASDLLVQRLVDWGVDTVFGLPGDGINGIMEGLRRHQEIATMADWAPITGVETAAFTVPLDAPESDGGGRAPS